MSDFLSIVLWVEGRHSEETAAKAYCRTYYAVPETDVVDKYEVHEWTERGDSLFNISSAIGCRRAEELIRDVLEGRRKDFSGCWVFLFSTRKTFKNLGIPHLDSFLSWLYSLPQAYPLPVLANGVIEAHSNEPPNSLSELTHMMDHLQACFVDDNPDPAERARLMTEDLMNKREWIRQTNVSLLLNREILLLMSRLDELHQHRVYERMAHETQLRELKIVEDRKIMRIAELQLAIS
ncbi:MAG: hypothetical protein JW384_02984 [Nitrosomonadaceae bacterium]|nr:hypothetical protein [Nitrosomonadaceae bacterium]